MMHSENKQCVECPARNMHRHLCSIYLTHSYSHSVIRHQTNKEEHTTLRNTSVLNKNKLKEQPW